jgi:hypothetical protein
MLNAHFRKLSKNSIPIVVAAAAFTLPAMRLQAQPTAIADGVAGYEVACSIQDSSGFRACGEPPSGRSCDAEGTYASQPSKESTDITFDNRSDKAVKVYWLNFKGERVLYQSLAPSGRIAQPTFVGHNWLIATLGEQCVGIFETASASIVDDGSVTLAPPAIPEYEQPAPPEDGLVWTPGYWAWSEDVGDYYWVAGTWMDAPTVGYLWTPGYWFARRGRFVWQAGYWGPHVGFYGGINYGFGYFGRGFVGGAWRDGRMMYNSAVTNVGQFRSANTYNHPVPNDASIGRMSYSGGGGGTHAQPNAGELAAAGEHHIPPTMAQLQQLRTAHGNPAMRAGFNNGHPSIAAVSRPGENSSASTPSVQHGTLSFTHSVPAPHAARATGTAVSSRAPAQSTSAAAVHAQSQPRAQSQPQVARASAEKQSAPQEDRQPHQTSSQTHPRTVPRAEGHPP